MTRRRLAVLTILAAALLALALPAAAAAGPTTYTFNLQGPNSALAPSGPHAGDTIRVTGSRSFDPAARTIMGSGSFTHADGTVHQRGTWRGTGFTSFTGFGGPSPGQQGGVLWMVVTHFPNGEAPHPGIPMSVTSTVNAPPGLIQGTTVAEFTVKTGGKARFHLAS